MPSTTPTADPALDDETVLSKAQLLARLRRVGASIRRVEAKRDTLYEERRDLIVAGRDAEDQATQRELAEAAGVSETVIINALAKVKAKADAEAAAAANGGSRG